MKFKLGMEMVKLIFKMFNMILNLDNENVGIESENVGIESENVGIDIKGENVEKSERYVSQNYKRNEEPLMEERQIPNSKDSRAPKRLLETDKNIIDNREGKKPTQTI